MTLKLATKEDLPRLQELSYAFFLHSPYTELKYDKAKAEETFLTTWDKRDDFLWLLYVDEDEEIQGFLFGVKASPVFSSDAMASELAWWIDPLARNFKAAVEMLDAYEYWASIVGCKEAALAHLDSDENSTLTKWYKRRGYDKRETAFVKGLK